MGLRPDLAPHENKQPETYVCLAFAPKGACKGWRIFYFHNRGQARLARAGEFRWRTWGRTGILRAAATREND